jgi:hypothetical protein
MVIFATCWPTAGEPNVQSQVLNLKAVILIICIKWQEARVLQMVSITDEKF